jgi:hypothetical protein
MLLGSFMARFSYGLLVMAAPESTDAHDGWNSAQQAIHAGVDSIYVGVRDTTAGLVKVVCVEGAGADTELSEVFSGRLMLPSARLKFYDPDQTITMIVPVSAECMGVEIYADNDEEPSELYIHLTGK